MSDDVVLELTMTLAEIFGSKDDGLEPLEIGPVDDDEVKHIIHG